MRFRLRANGHQLEPTAVAAPVEPATAPAVDEPAAAPAATVEPAAAAPIPAPFAARPGAHAALKTQMSGSDVRTERVARQIRGEIDELRQSVAAFRETPDEMTALDLDAVAESPDAAAALPPALLVRALVEARDRNARLEKQLAKRRDRIERLEERVRELKQERAFLRGRMETFDDVIAALHANIQDLRLHRDALPAGDPRPGPRALHGAPGLIEPAARVDTA
ncbi:MAG: hypothetical protein IT303_09655 [Dehalococcoidia bacterium]|nr:hypothetical protein [Dehalococcoidia bacterium]